MTGASWYQYATTGRWKKIGLKGVKNSETGQEVETGGGRDIEIESISDFNENSTDQEKKTNETAPTHRSGTMEK